VHTVIELHHVFPARLRSGFAIVKSLAWAGTLTLALLAMLPGAALGGSRIKDIASFEGIRDNMLVGYGLVVGLNGTGDRLNNSAFTQQSLVAMLERLGIRRTSPPSW
jgi:flagellar P-ring protein precursor FlgI